MISINHHVLCATGFVVILTEAFSATAPGNESWPLATYGWFLVHARTMPDCLKSKALTNWIYWLATSETGISLANGYPF